MGTRPVPARFGVSQGFGANPTGGLPWNHPTIQAFGNYQPGGHNGIDFACPVGTPVFAIEDGVVSWADWGTKLPGDNSHAGWVSRYYLDKVGSGIPVCIDHAGPKITSIYAHLNATKLNPGDRVVKGQFLGTVKRGQIAESGNTGRSTGPHLHFEVIPYAANWANGFYGRINPAPYITEALERGGVVTPAPKSPTVTSKIKTWYPLTSKAFTTAANCPHVFKFARPARPVSDVIHHWDDPARKPTFEGTEAYLRNQPSNGVSAHWIGEAWRVSAMVDEKHASHANGHAAANAMTVTHEWNPRCSADDREALADHLSNRWIARGYTTPGLIEVHQDYYATACPGRYAQHLPEIRARAAELFAAKRRGQGTGAAAVVKPKPQPTRVPVLKGVPAYAHVAGKKAFHRARKGDTVWAITQHFGTPVATFKRWNSVGPNNVIIPGVDYRVR